MKKIKKKKDSRSGFTLIELLATITILSIIISIVIYVAISVVGKSKDKSYNVTINNIETSANQYLLENSKELFFVALATNNDLEYQCIQVRNLVDMGYFDNNIVDSLVSDDDTVSLDDYIYVERNNSSKTINRTKYLYDSEMVEYTRCDIARDISGYIYFNLKPVDWSREKDLVINYVLKNDLNKSNYSYEYSYLENGEEKIDKITDNSNSKKLVIKENGNVLAYIYDKEGNKIADASINISKIDRVGPAINHSYEGNYYVGNDVNIPFIVTDVGSGVDYSSFTLDDIIVKINGVVINEGLTFTNIGNGKFNLNIVNNNYHGDLDIIINADRVYDKVENGNSLKEFKDILVFDNVPPICRLSVTSSGITFDKKEDNGEIYTYGMNMTGEAVYDKTDNLELDEGTFYGYVKDTAGNVGSCSAKLNYAEVSEYTKTTNLCGYSNLKCWNYSSYSCPSGYNYCSWCDTSDCYKVTSSYSCDCTYICTKNMTNAKCDDSGGSYWDNGVCYAYKKNSCGSWTYFNTYSCDTCYNYAYTSYNRWCSYSNVEGEYLSGKYCYLANQGTECPSGWGISDYTEYGFITSTTKVEECEPTSSFTCSSSNLEKSYVSCTPKEYKCSTGELVDKYCYVING